MTKDVQIPINSDKDVVLARQQGRSLALQLGFSLSEVTLIAMAISELSRNIVLYAGTGTVTLKSIHGSSRVGLMIVAADAGPGIADVTRAMRDGYSSSGGLGLGLPGVRRLMDEFDISSEIGRGTIVTGKKWRL
ncbi:MAG TPA: anti-sigma regulatory factor [Steroidobacteraceae bacterium]